MKRGTNSPRYIVGIDLGTTHTVVAYADTAEAHEPRLFEIEQLVAPGEVAARPLLPSLRYHPVPGELAPGDIGLPWPQSVPTADDPPAVLGELARELGAKAPGRLVVSAKSWLSHGSVDRTASILPWGGAGDVFKISPLHASASYLAYIRAAWNRRFEKHSLENQDVVLTLPASFDEAARALTVRAAGLAGLPRVRLLEEPQAACYDWLHRHEGELETAARDIRLLLVCDVGGGTTDLTLVSLDWRAEVPRLNRIAVGDHLMLGGDNMDLAIAHVAERRLLSGGVRLEAARLSQLMQQCRGAKERLLARNAPQSATVTLLGKGAKLIGGARSVEFSNDEIRGLVVEGFLPRSGPEEHPEKRRSAIVEFGLPYAADPAISRHVADFLANHSAVAREALGERAPARGALPVPDAVLLNGGVFHGEALTERLLDILAGWRGESLKALHNDDPDLAVARGAVAYAMALRGRGLRIGGGSARSYFLRLEDGGEEKRAVCLLPRGTREERELSLKERSFSLRLGQPVRFHLLSSTADRVYEPGVVLSFDDEQFKQLPPIATLLEDKTDAAGRPEVPVQLATRFTEVGTLAVSCVDTEQPDKRWKLEFQLRGGGAGAVTSPDAEIHSQFHRAATLIERIYGGRSRAVGPREVKTLRGDLEKILGKRESWDTPLLRELFSAFLRGLGRRRRSPDHERLWLNLTGFCLRPGFGYPLDDWRVQQLWPIYEKGIQYVDRAQIWAEWWILWRRVAGGLDEQAQERILEDISDELKPVRVRRKRRPGTPGRQGYDDMVRLVASLERLPVARKVDAGGWLLERLRKKAESPQSWWAVGRLGARVPFYGSAHNVVPEETAMEWLERMLALNWRSVQQAGFAATMLGRRSGDRQRDMDPAIRSRIAQRLRAAKAPASWVRMVEEVVQLEAADEKRIFGDSLPPGLKLMH